jgi:hypothetical protein
MKAFLPWFGHFGDLIRDVLPWIWAHWRPGDIVGGNPLHGPLYPSPPDARLWAPVAAHYPQGYDYRIRPDDLEAALRRVAHDLWPRAGLIAWTPDGEPHPKPPIPLPEPYPVDVVLAPRAKPYADAKNGWPWAALAAELRARGRSVGIAGSRSESAAVAADVAAWDLEPAVDAITGTLRLLHGATVVVTLDSGIGHLASLVDAPHLVIYPTHGDERRSLMVRDGVPTRMRFADMHRWNRRLCLPVWGGVPEALAAIEEVIARTRLVPGAIDRWKRRHVSAVPGWHQGETLVLKEAHRSLIMRPSGNDLVDTVPLDDTPPFPSHAEADRRAAICRACPHYRAGNDQCALCGCGFIVAERTRSPMARCPGDRW